MPDDDRSKLVGHWVHAHEEDEGKYRVFRRAGVKLPPSRGRAELEILPDLTALRSGPGADDRPAAGPDCRIVFGTLMGPADAGPDLKVVDVSDDRLRVARD